MTKKMLAAAALVLGAAGAVSGIPVLPAHAGDDGPPTYRRDCPVNYSCVNSEQDGTGIDVAIAAGVEHGAERMAPPNDGRLLSFWNRTGRICNYYSGYDFTGELVMSEGAYGYPKNNAFRKDIRSYRCP